MRRRLFGKIVREVTSCSIDITRFDYDAAPVEGTDNLYPNLDFTVTEKKEYSDGSPSETSVDNVSYRGGQRVSGSEWSPRFTKVSGEFGVDSSTGRVYGIGETEESGDENIELGEVRVDIDIASYASASATTKVYQKENEETQEDTSFPMDILMLNNETHKQEIMGRDEHTTKDFPKRTYTPIGIILTPAADDDGIEAGKQYSGYGDIGVMGVIALTDASLASPETGATSPSEILCGSRGAYNGRMRRASETGTGKRDVDQRSVIPCIDNNGTPTAETTEWFGDAADNYPDYNSNLVSAPTDKDTTVENPTDIWSGYAKPSGKKAPSPYYVTEEYKKNCQEYGDSGDFEGYNDKAYTESTEYSGESALADYAGEFNSLAILLGISDARNRSWIENPITDSNANTTDCPAVMACWKYAPEGTAQGGWYLPALGELSLMAARLNKINETMELLATYYGVSVSKLNTDGGVPYLSSTYFDCQLETGVTTTTVFALFPNVDGEAGYNKVGTSDISGVGRFGGYVRPFKKIRNDVPAKGNAYNFTPHYELMPAHYTNTFCNGVSNREWFGQKFIVSFRRACMGQLNNTTLYSSMDGSRLRIYGYKVKGENDTTKVDETPRLLAETYVEGVVSQSLMVSTSAHWPQVPDGHDNYVYEGDEMGVNIVGRFTTTPLYDTAGAFDRDTDADLDMDTDEFDRDGTVEPGWYVLAGIGVTTTTSTSWEEKETIISTPFYQTIMKKEIDIIDEVESKEAFFDEIRHSTLFNLTERTGAPFYVGQLDRPVAILLGAETISESD